MDDRSYIHTAGASPRPTGAAVLQNVEGIHECPADLGGGRSLIAPTGAVVQIPTQKRGFRPFLYFCLQNDADQTVAALVDDLFQGIADLGARCLGHMLQLCVQSLVDQLVQALAKHI